jgi:hypothetical protein
MPGYRSLVEPIRFSFNNLYCPLRAVTQASAQSITQVIGSQHRLAVYDFDGTFRACGNAQPATVASLLINLNNISFHLASPAFV